MLKLYPNQGKSEIVRYTQSCYLRHLNLWTGKLFFNGNKTISTLGLGQLANQAQHKARGIIRAQTAAAKATGDKVNVPVVKNIGCPAKIEASKSSNWSYWVSVENEWSKGRVRVPALSHRGLNKKLRNGWVLTSTCEVVRDKGRYFVRVFVSKEITRAKPREKTLGCDIGYRNSVSRSDSYIGHNLSRVIVKQRTKRAEQQRQGHSKSAPKTVVKQLLDLEARAAIGRSRRLSASLIIESPKVVGKLGRQKLQGWAAAYFANRCHVLGQEEEVFVWEVNPAYTSQTCSQCGCLDKRSRNGLRFACVHCGHSANADINAAINIAEKGTVSLRKYIFSGKQEPRALVEDLPS